MVVMAASLYPWECNEPAARYTPLGVMGQGSTLLRVDVTTLPDAELARRIVTAAPGEASEAEGELYARLAPRVRLYGLRHLRDAQLAADLMQQVMMMTIERLRNGKVHEPERLASYVLGMCRMVVLGLQRVEIGRASCREAR